MKWVIGPHLSVLSPIPRPLIDVACTTYEREQDDDGNERYTDTVENRHILKIRRFYVLQQVSAIRSANVQH